MTEHSSQSYVRGWRRGYAVAAGHRRSRLRLASAAMFLGGLVFFAVAAGVFWSSVAVYEKGFELALQTRTLDEVIEKHVITKNRAWNNIYGRR